MIEILNKQSSVSKATSTVTLSELRWLGLQCRVQADSDSDGVVAVLRKHAANPDSEISKRKPLKEGKCTLMVDDEYEDTSAVLVLLDEHGNVLAKKPTLVGDV